jgi:hypothetical protein
MGLGHCLIKMGYRYDNAEGRKNGRPNIMNYIKKRAYEASTYIAARKRPISCLRYRKIS